MWCSECSARSEYHRKLHQCCIKLLAPLQARSEFPNRATRPRCGYSLTLKWFCCRYHFVSCLINWVLLPRAGKVQPSPLQAVLPPPSPSILLCRSLDNRGQGSVGGCPHLANCPDVGVGEVREMDGIPTGVSEGSTEIAKWHQIFISSTRAEVKGCCVGGPGGAVMAPLGGCELLSSIRAGKSPLKGRTGSSDLTNLVCRVTAKCFLWHQLEWGGAKVVFLQMFSGRIDPPLKEGEKKYFLPG